jgi:alginate O-acetyltransferase complex protein AlgI
MLFNSFIFWFFFLIVIVIYRQLSHTPQNRLLLVASYLFYGFWDYRFLSLIFISTVIDFIVAQKIVGATEEKNKKKCLIVSIAFNLGMLGFFKYWNFFIGEFSGFLDILGFSASVPMLNVILPVGISFYTFQTMSYTIDVYRGKTKPADNFLNFALYVSFFPQLVAGPIERSSHLLPQITVKRKTNGHDFSEGFYHVLTGLFKKVVIADNMAPLVNTIFSRPVSDLTGPEIIMGVYAFAFQIYGDFSGYSSIAKGIAHWMGFDLMWNFKNPYFSASPSEFWTRWHISLSSWLRDYLYIPLGGNRGGVNKTFRNLMATMCLGGLWHGAGWTYMLWGFYHGILLMIYHFIESRRALAKPNVVRLNKVVRIFFFFNLVAISWLFFRAESIGQISDMLILVFSDFTITAFAVYGVTTILFFVAPLMLLEYWTERSGNLLVLLESNWKIRFFVYSYFIGMLIVFPPLLSQEFIYFQF